MQQSGFYTPRYDFRNAEKYSEKLEEIRDKQRKLIKDGNAIVCPIKWEVGGSKAEGKKMISRLIKLGLASFNVQADNIILTVKYSNIGRCEEKIEKVRENVEKLLEVNKCTVTNEFFKAKVEELFLAYEYQEQLQLEKEEQREIRLQMQEEEKARRESEKAQKEAEEKESKYEVELLRVRRDLEKRSESERQDLLEQIAFLEANLADATAEKERAKSQAELTKQGHVYVISNIGSFGDEVFKIGMTRRFDPQDRVDELGDASVPFEFDVHAMIPSKDAPDLERQLHQMFHIQRVNKMNTRKEFFNVTLEQIEVAVIQLGYKPKLTRIAEAKEFRLTQQQIKEAEKTSTAQGRVAA